MRAERVVFIRDGAQARFFGSWRQANRKSFIEFHGRVKRVKRVKRVTKVTKVTVGLRVSVSSSSFPNSVWERTCLRNSVSSPDVTLVTLFNPFNLAIGRTHMSSKLCFVAARSERPHSNKRPGDGIGEKFSLSR